MNFRVKLWTKPLKQVLNLELRHISGTNDRHAPFVESSRFGVARVEIECEQKRLTFKFQFCSENGFDSYILN